MKARLASPTNEQKTQESIKSVTGGDMRKREEEAVWSWVRRSGRGLLGLKGNGRKSTGEQGGYLTPVKDCGT